MLVGIAVLFPGSLFAQSAGGSKAAASCPALLNKTFPRLQDDAPLVRRQAAVLSARAAAVAAAVAS